MLSSRSRMLVLSAVAGLVLALALPSRADADGGPILSDPELWAMIDEGQQIAVVRLQRDGTAQVDLFISMADRSGQSHEVTFFLPLGIEAGDFEVVEETSLSFDQALTEPIDEQLEAESRRQDDFRERLHVALLLGTLTTHAAWLPPFLFSVSVSMYGWGIGAAGPPLATFETPSSRVAIYDLNPETDLQSLIETTGLDPKVKETLAALEGQQIAVIKLQTQPVGAEGESRGRREPAGQPGIHLSWRSTLVSHSATATYTYPLGTGKAWASPIEHTRVYVVSPPELDFIVDYPQLGDDLSGMRETRYRGLAWKIDDAKSPAFAVDEAYGEFGHIWRATYVKSNSAQDVVVRSLPEPSREMRRAIRRARVQELAQPLTLLIAPLVGLAAWVTAWWVVMRRRLGVPYRWREGRLYRDALMWAGLYLIPILVGVSPVYLQGFSHLHLPRILWQGAACAGSLLALVSALGLVNAFLYARWKAEKLQVTRGRAFGAYMLAVLMANVLYAVFAVAYYAIAGAI